MKLQLTLQKKLFLIIGIGFFLNMVVMFLVQKEIVLPTYNQIELDIAQKDLNRAKEAIQNEIKHLDHLCHDWGSWDDTYYYIDDKNSEYAESNLIIESFTNANFNILYLFNRKGEMVWGKVYDLGKEEEVKIDIGTSNFQKLAQYLISQSGPDKVTRGIVQTKLHPLILSIRPVLKSDDSGPSNGWIIMGHFLDSRELERIAELCQVPFLLAPMNSKIPAVTYDSGVRISQKGETTLYSVVKEKSIESYLVIAGLAGHNTFLLSSTFPREISIEGRENSYYAIIVNIVTVFGIVLFMLALLRIRILRPLKRLLFHIREIVEEGDYSLRISERSGGVEIGIIAKEFNILVDKVERQTKELEHLSTIDGLTGLNNRRSFNATFESEWERLKRLKQPLCLILCDVDFFKPYNDNYGHQAGDQTLIKVAQALKESATKPTDLTARYGGEEFVLILANTSAQGGAIVAQRILEVIESYRIPHDYSKVAGYITISCGVSVVIPNKMIGKELLLKEADEALYEAKEQGRNRVVVKEL